MRHCIIVVGGHINDIFAKEFIEKERPELCIAADSGMNFFYRNIPSDADELPMSARTGSLEISIQHPMRR